MVPIQSAELLLIVRIVCRNLLVKLYNLLVFLGNPLICCNILIIKWCHDLIKKGRTQGVVLLVSKAMKIYIRSSHCVSACCDLIGYSFSFLLKTASDCSCLI